MRYRVAITKELATRHVHNPRHRPMPHGGGTSPASTNVTATASPPDSNGNVTWTFSNQSQEQLSVILHRGAQTVSPYYFGSSFWAVYNLTIPAPFATSLTALGNDLSGPGYQTAPLGLIRFSGQAFLVAYVYTLGPGQQWQTMEGGFIDPKTNTLLPAMDIFCVEVTSEDYAQFAITYDPSLPAAADTQLSTNSPGFAPNPNIFWAISFVPTPANPPYIENWVMTYAEQSEFLGEQQWLPWQSLSAPPGESISGPAACSWGQSRVDVFAVGSDSELWHLWTDDDGDYQSWQSQEWESLSGNLTLDPAAVSLGVGLISVFGRGPDMALWSISYLQEAFYPGGQSLGWSNWASLSAPGVGAWNGVPVSSEGDWPLLSPSPGLGIVSKPTAISWGPQLLVVYVFAVTAESGTPALWFLNFNGSSTPSGWATNWEALALQPPDIAAGTGPCAASWANGRTDLIVMGQTGLWHTWFDYSQGGWAPTWENLFTLPGVTPPPEGFQNRVPRSSSAAGQLDVFLRSIPYARSFVGGNDGACALWHLTFDQGEWQGWETLGGQITSDPAAVSVALPDGNGIEVFTCGNDGNLWHLQFAFGQTDPVPPSPFT